MEPKESGPPHGQKKSRRGGKRETSKPKCTGTSKQTKKPCGHTAGYGTDHPGIGNCKFHGGSSPIKHGLYSKVVKEQNRQLIDELMRTPEDFGNIDRELAHVKVLIHQIAEKTETINLEILPAAQTQALQSLVGIAVLTDVNRDVLLVKLYSLYTQMAERREKMRESQIWQKVMVWLATYTKREYEVLRRHITSPSVLQAIGRDLATLVPGQGALAVMPRRDGKKN